MSQHARQSSGLYDFHRDGYSSNELLTSNAVPAAGTQPWNEQSNSVYPSQSPKKVPFYKTRKFIISQLILIPLGIILLFILLFPVVRAIAQLIVNKSSINVDVATLAQMQNNSFQLDLKGFIAHTSNIPAKIHFTQPIRISWIQDDGSEAHLGTLNLSDISAKKGRAIIDQSNLFSIDDESSFEKFAQHMITASNFTWRMQSKEVQVRAASFPLSKGIQFDKSLTLSGFGSFNGNVVLKQLSLPSDSPSGGINFSAITVVTNPSPFSLDLGTVVFDLSYKSVLIGSGTSNNTVIKPGPNDITLVGVLKPQVELSDLAAVSELFTNYINGDESPVVAIGRSSFQSDGTAVSWLANGLQALQLTVPFKPLDGPLNPIRNIAINDFALQFFEQTPWSPTADSRSIKAGLALPFGFSVDIGQIQNNFSISRNGDMVVGLSTPMGASKSAVTVFNSTYTGGSIDITIANTNLSTAPSSEIFFSQFNAALTTGDKVDFNLVGNSRAVANTSIGQIVLDPIKVNVGTSLRGLQGLKGATTINAIDVIDGTEEGIVLSINTTIHNPSNLQLSVGDLNLQLARDSSTLGTVSMPNLKLKEGNNSIAASALFQANASPSGLQTLNDFVRKKDSHLNIKGYDNSTKIASLFDAFNALDIDVIMPGLKKDLLLSAGLKVLSTTGKDNVSHVTVELENPFSAPLRITNVKSVVSAKGIQLGSIDTKTDFTIGSKSKTHSPELALNMNLDPAALFTLTRQLASEAGLDVTPLDAIVQIGEIQYLNSIVPSLSKKRQHQVFDGFDLTSFVHKAFAKLKSDVQISSDIMIGKYSTSIQINQNGVTTITDNTLDLLLPVLASPIVQKLVSSATLRIDNVIISNPKQTSFDTKLQGSITNAGPFDATISFKSGLSVAYAGRVLGSLAMKDVKLTGDVGAKLQSTSSFSIKDADSVTGFAKDMLTKPSFEWEISGSDLSVSALGLSVPGINLPPKTVTLKGFNGLQRGVKIQTFSLPGDAKEGGIQLTLQAEVQNPSQVGIELSSIGFDTFSENVKIAEVRSSGGVALKAGSASILSLAGRLVPQSTDDGRRTVSALFNNVVHGKDSNVSVRGASAGPGDVTWLNEGIKALQVATVLPNQGTFDLIQSITLADLSVTIQNDDQAFAPLTSSQGTKAQFKNPFGFSLSIIESGQTITLSSQGVDIAQLNLPTTSVTSGVSNGNAADLVISWQDQTMSSLDNDAFASLFTAVTNTDKAAVTLKGSAQVTARTPIGNIPISDIAFNVDSELAGLNAFGHKAQLKDVKVVGSGTEGGVQFINVPLTTTLQNPSNVSLHTTHTDLSVFFKDIQVGRAVIQPFDLLPGENAIATQFRYQPANANDTIAQSFLSEVMSSSSDVAVSIRGDSGSIPFASLQPALAALTLGGAVPGLNAALVKEIKVELSLGTLTSNMVNVEIMLHNPFDTDVKIEFVQSDAGLDGKTYASFQHTFPNLILPAGQTVNTGKVENVLLTQGAFASLGIIPRGVLDTSIAATAQMGSGGYTVPWLQLQQKNVPTKYDLGGLSLRELTRRAEEHDQARVN